jgi:hypothetical protein
LPPDYDSDEEYEVAVYKQKIQEMKQRHKVEKQQLGKEIWKYNQINKSNYFQKS